MFTAIAASAITPNRMLTQFFLTMSIDESFSHGARADSLLVDCGSVRHTWAGRGSRRRRGAWGSGGCAGGRRRAARDGSGSRRLRIELHEERRRHFPVIAQVFAGHAVGEYDRIVGLPGVWIHRHARIERLLSSAERIPI